MSYKLFELSPQASTRIIRMRPAPERRRIAVAPRKFSDQESLPIQGFLQEWLEEDSVLENAGEGVHINWGAISGLAFSLALSLSIWTGVIWVIGRIWK